MREIDDPVGKHRRDDAEAVEQSGLRAPAREGKSWTRTRTSSRFVRRRICYRGFGNKRLLRHARRRSNRGPARTERARRPISRDRFTVPRQGARGFLSSNRLRHTTTKIQVRTTNARRLISRDRFTVPRQSARGSIIPTRTRVISSQDPNSALYWSVFLCGEAAAAFGFRGGRLGEGLGPGGALSPPPPGRATARCRFSK